MANADRTFWIHALTPLHVGAGKGEGYIDLPLVREKITNYPYVPGSAVKGVFADHCRATDDARDPSQPPGTYKKELHAAFGRAGDDTANAGALVFTDARLVCLPVRSLYGTFAWCACPMILQRLHRDLSAAGSPNLPQAPTSLAQGHVPEKADHTGNKFSDTDLVIGNSQKVYLEDLDIDIAACPVATKWANLIASFLFPGNPPWRGIFTRRFLVLPDDVFSFLADTGTEVRAHVRIEEGFKRVASGALWYEESLAAETILSGLVWCDDPKDRVSAAVTKQDVLNLLNDCSLQMGGKATTGKGRVQLMFQAPASTTSLPGTSTAAESDASEPTPGGNA